MSEQTQILINMGYEPKIANALLEVYPDLRDLLFVLKQKDSNIHINSENVYVFNETIKRCLGDSFIGKMIQGSRDKSCFYNHEPDINLSRRNKGIIKISNYTLIDTLIKWSSSNKKLAFLNFASPTNPGGGVIIGGKGQEEDNCRNTTLYPILVEKKYIEKYYKSNKIKNDRWGTDDCIYIPDVIIFNHVYDNLMYADVISCAAPNMRGIEHELLNSSEIKHMASEVFKKRIKKILKVACDNNVEILILGAFGCGAFRNDPQIVASAFKVVLREYRYMFHSIIFSIVDNDTSCNYNIF